MVFVPLSVLFVAACSGGGDAAPTPPTDEPPSEAAPEPAGPTDTTIGEPATEQSLSTLVWSRVEPEETVFGGDGNQEALAVAATQTGIVAVGFENTEDFDAAVWTSPDGVVWSRVPHDEVVFGGNNTQTMRSVAALGPLITAVGNDRSFGDWDAAAWASDGSLWARAPFGEVLGGEANQQMDGVAATDSGFVAVGHEETDEDWDTAVWTSPDGANWSRVPHDEAVFGGDGNQEALSVATTSMGIVVVGWENKEDFDAAVWTSPDGVVWSRVPHDEAVFGGDDTQTMRGVAGSASGYVAVGNDHSGGDWDAAAWTSPDGQVWTRVPHDEAVFGGDPDQQMDSVVLTDVGFVAVGHEETDEDWDMAAWTSPDGFAWSRVPHDEAVFGGDGNQEALSVAATQTGVVAVGFENTEDFDAAVWVGVFGDG